MEVPLEALPFLFPESQRGELQQWRAAAVRRERELVVRRQARLQALKDYVQRRLKEIEERRRVPNLQSETSTESMQCSEPSAQPEGRAPGGRVDTEEVRGGEDVGDTVSGSRGPARIEEDVTHPHADSDRGLQYHSHSDSGVASSSGPTFSHPPSVPTWPEAPGAQPHTHGLYYISPRRRLFTPGEDRYPHSSSTRTFHQDPYAKLTAVARGFLTRRLLRSVKVDHHVQTIKDAGVVLNSLDKPSSHADIALRERVTTQLQVARMNLHEIFFDLPVEEKMAYIAHSRVLRQQRKLRHSRIPRPPASSVSMTTVTLGTLNSDPAPSSARGKLSSATMRAIERRQREKGMNTSTVAGRKSAVKSESKTLSKPSMNSKDVPRPVKPVTKPDRQVSSNKAASMRRHEGGGRRGGEVKSVIKGSHSLRGKGKENQNRQASASKSLRTGVSRPVPEKSLRTGASRSGTKPTHTK